MTTRKLVLITPAIICIILLALWTLFPPSPALASEQTAAVNPVWSQLIDRLAADGYSRDEMIALFARPEVVYMPQVIRSKVVPQFNRKFYPPKKTGGSVAATLYKALVIPERINEAKVFLNENLQLFEQAEQIYQVPKEILVAIIAVETRLGTFLGKQYAFSALASLSLASDMSMVLPFFSDRKLTVAQTDWIRKRATGRGDWAYAELKALLAYAEASQTDPVSLPGSIYGAIGICQFMPSNALRLGVDGNKDGHVDLFHLPDAVHSIGNFLKFHRWNPKEPLENNRKAIMAYNPSKIYTNTVIFIAKALQL